MRLRSYLAWLNYFSLYSVVVSSLPIRTWFRGSLFLFLESRISLYLLLTALTLEATLLRIVITVSGGICMARVRISGV